MDVGAHLLPRLLYLVIDLSVDFVCSLGGIVLGSMVLGSMVLGGTVLGGTVLGKGFGQQTRNLRPFQFQGLADADEVFAVDGFAVEEFVDGFAAELDSGHQVFPAPGAVGQGPFCLFDAGGLGGQRSRCHGVAI